MFVEVGNPALRQDISIAETFSGRIKETVGPVHAGNFSSLLFQRERLLHRTPDPALVSWANALDISDSDDEETSLYGRYLLRKWLACLPPVFAQLSSLQSISFGETAEVSLTHAQLPTDLFAVPELVYTRLMHAFVQTIPFFAPTGRSLREATWMLEGAVFSLEEWWQTYLDKFRRMPESVEAPVELALHYLAQRLAAYLSDGALFERPAQTPQDSMVDMLAHAVIHSYVG